MTGPEQRDAGALSGPAEDSVYDPAAGERASDDPAADSAARPRRVSPRPSPAASAASRARRIGGRTNSPGASTAPGPSTPPGASTPPVSTVKTAPAGHRVAPRADVREDDVREDDDTVHIAPAGAAAGAVPNWLRWAPAAILTAGVLALVVLMAIVSHGVWWGGGDSAASRDKARDQVSAAAKTCVAATNTYKYTALNQFEATGAACTTGQFTTTFKKAVDTLIKPNAGKLKFTQTAQINKSAIESVADGQWTVLLFGQLTVTNVNTPKGRTDPFAAAVRMEKVNGKWLISDLRPIG